MRKDLNDYLACLYVYFAKRNDKRKHQKAPHSHRRVQILSLFGWTNIVQPYRPKEGFALCAALGILGKTTPTARELISRCGALGGSFKEAKDTLCRLTGMDLSSSKLRNISLAEGEAAYDELQNPSSDIRSYSGKPKDAVTKVDHTLFSMADGGSANCCKVDTCNTKGKNGDATTRQIRVAIFGEYEWLDKNAHPIPYTNSFSYAVCGGNIEEFTATLRKHGLSRGCNTATRMHCLADGETALEKAFRDAFPHAIFTNDFYHTCEHLHECIKIIIKDSACCEKEYIYSRNLLHRYGAKSVIKRLHTYYEDKLNEHPDALDHLRYLQKREDNMCYSQRRKEGLHIGTGHIEAAVRILIVRRTKQAGMHWRHVNAVYIAALHAKYRSHRKMTSAPTK